MEPMILGMKDDGSQNVWWTCSDVKAKKCDFPLNMPDDIFWVSRTKEDIDRNEVPPPNLSNLPVRYQHLYPSLFQSTPRRANNDSRQGSHESTRSVSSMESATSTSTSAWDTTDQTKNRTAVKLETMRKPKVAITRASSFIPSIAGGNRAMAFTDSFGTEERASTSLLTKIKFGRGDQKTVHESRETLKKMVIQALKKQNPDEFKKVSATHIREMKQAVIEHVKKRRAEREQLAQLNRMADQRNKVFDINDLVKAKLQKNKREYEQRRIEKAREARMMAARQSRTAAQLPSPLAAGALPTMPGYGEEEDDEEERLVQQMQHASEAPYAVTPPYSGGGGGGGNSPGPSSYHADMLGDGQQPLFDHYGLLDYSAGSSCGGPMDHSGEVGGAVDPYDLDAVSSLYGRMGGEGEEAPSPFTDLGPLRDDDLDGLDADPTFEHAFAEAFGNDFDAFADLSAYN